jgi:hypothetical protein
MYKIINFRSEELSYNEKQKKIIFASKSTQHYSNTYQSSNKKTIVVENSNILSFYQISNSSGTYNHLKKQNILKSN